MKKKSFMRSGKIVPLFIFFILVSGFFLGTFSPTMATSYESGGYYIEDFTGFANGVSSFTSYISGVEWLSGYNIISPIIDIENAPANPYFMKSNTGASTFKFNLSQQTTFWGMKIYYNSDAGADRFNYYWYFNDTADNNIFYINIKEDEPITSVTNLYIYDSDDTLLKTHLNVGQGWRYLNFTFINSNNSILYTNNFTGNPSEYFSPTHYDYIGYIFMTALPGAGGTWDVGFDDIRILYEDVNYQWYINYDTYGNVVLDYDSDVTYSLAVQNNVILETQKDNTGLPLNIIQVALALGDLTDIALISVYARMGDTNLGEYDNYYIYNDRYVLIWEDINLSGSTPDTLFEFNIVKNSGSPQVNMLTIASDIDGDGDMHSYSGYDLTQYNGAYGGGTARNEDLLYQIWWGYGADVENQYGNVSDYEYRGNIYGADDCTALGYHYFEVEYDVYSTYTIQVVDLKVCDEQYNMDSNLNNYRIRVNGNDGGTPDYWMPYDDQYFIMRWILTNPPVLNNQKPLFEFYHSVSDANGREWYIATTQGDHFNDGRVGALMHGHDWMFYDGVYTGTDAIIYDPIVRFWYSGITIQDKEYDDEIITDKNTYETYDTVTIGGTVSDITYLNHLHIYYDIGAGWTEYTGQNYPKDIYTFDIYDTFQPLYAGDYNISLIRNSIVVAQKNITVTSNPDDDYIIVTYENPSTTGETVEIYYIFNHSYLNSGKIVLSDNPNTYDEDDLAWTINNTDTLTYLGNTYFSKEDIYYFHMLFIPQGSTSWYKKITHKHVNKDREYSNFIEVLTNPLYLASDSQQIINYQHNHLGSPLIKIMINDLELASDISTSSSGQVKHRIATSGDYTVNLVLRSGDGIIILDSDNFTAVAGESEVGEDVLVDAIRNLPLSYRLIIGLAIIIMITLLPMIIGLYMAKHRISINIPSLIYVAFFFLGVITSVLLGFFEIWILFIILFGLVLVWAITWMQKQGSNKIESEE